MKWIRVIHRDLGFLMVGVCFVYGISGMMLNHMNGKDPAFHTVNEQLTVDKGLSATELKVALGDMSLPSVKRVLPVDDSNLRVMFDGGIGIYNSRTGDMEYELYERRPFIYWVNKLHYNKLSHWNVMGDLFAISLIFFALSGLLMVKGKNGIAGRGKWYLIVGIIIPILYILLS
jgi:hypothetical protein